MQLLARTLGLSVESLTTGVGFSIPNLPDERMDGFQRAIRDILPTVELGSIQSVDLKRESTKVMTLREAKAFLDRSHKEGLTVWVVASPGTPR